MKTGSVVQTVAWSVILSAILASVVYGGRQTDRPLPSGFGRRPQTSEPRGRTRRAQLQKGSRLVEHLKASDDTLELVDEQPPSLPPPPVPPGHPDYGKSAIQLATEQSEIVVLVRVLAVSSTLSADETAILDTVSTQVETVLKSTPPGSLHVGDHLDLSSNGIKVSIGRQTIKLIESQQAPPLQAGGHYLVFAGRSGVSYVVSQGNPNATIKLRMQPAVAYGAFDCINPRNNNRCGGNTDNTTSATGNIESSIINFAGNNPSLGVGFLTEANLLFIMLHELGHAQGLDDIYDAEASGKTVMYASYDLTAPTECDGLMVKRVSSEKRAGFLADPCRGGVCVANANLNMCIWGGPPRNGNCFPTWMTEPLKGDVRWRMGSGNYQPFTNITTPPIIPPSGALGLNTLDPDGKVMRVDWYVGGQYVFTALDDPFELPYANVAPGSYVVRACAWDDREAIGCSSDVTVTIQGGTPGLVVSSFKAYSTSQFVAAEGGGGSYLVANRTDANAWEQFVLVPQPGGGTALMASNGMYVAAEGGGNGEVNANRTTIGPWETFFLVDLGDGWVAWRTWNGYFLRADPNLAGRLDARGAPAPSGPGPWETFFRY